MQAPAEHVLWWVGAVASKLKMRTEQQCLHRWLKSVNPEIRSGKWHAQEDVQLKLAVRAFGACHWSRIALFVPGRTDIKSTPPLPCPVSIRCAVLCCAVLC